uniref:Cystatin domain-containing protein n=1 Tax=Heterorhabditis bacteriophora TaxID=37862 RepID=A0A1I7WY82_HETBA
MILRQRSESCRIFLMLLGILYALILLNAIFLSGPKKKYIYGRVRLAIDDVKPATRSMNITIVIVIGKDTNINEYSFALNTVKCYSLIHNYTLQIVRDNEYKEICPQKDIMFRRHCIVAEILEETDWRQNIL